MAMAKSSLVHNSVKFPICYVIVTYWWF